MYLLNGMFRYPFAVLPGPICSKGGEHYPQGNLYLEDNVVGFPKTHMYPLDSNLSGG